MSTMPPEHGPCGRCAWYRQVRPRSEILGAVAATTTQGPELAQAIAKIVDDEQKLRDAEAEMKAKVDLREKATWPTRPLMTDYCGLREADELYFIPESKNADSNTCDDFRDAKAKPLDRHACAECGKRVAAKGTDLDRAREEQYLELARQGIGAEAKSVVDNAQSALKDLRGGMSSRKALEIGRAYASNGVLLREPEYLDWCSEYSTPDSFVLCALRNPYNSCPAWAAAEAAAPAAPPSQTTTVTQEVPPMVQSPLLSPGPPPLTREASDRSIDLIDYMAAAVRGVDLIEPTPAMRDSFASYLATYYPMLDPQSRLFFATAPESLAQVQAVFPTLPEPNRTMCLQYWAQQLNAIFQFAGALLQPAPAPQFAPVPMQPMQQMQPAPAAYAAPPDPSVADYLHTIVSEGDRQEQEAAARGDTAQALLIQKNNELTYSTLLSNMANMQHSAMMAVANNFKA